MTRYSLSSLIEKVIKSKYDSEGDIPSHETVVRFLEANHPDAVDKYLDTHRTSLLSGAVTRTLATQRNALRSTQLATRLMDGSLASVFDLDTFWGTTFFVQGEGWKTLGSLTGSDHSLIADKYEIGAVAMSSRAELHRHLATKVGSKTTIEVLQPQALMTTIAAAYDTTALIGGA